MSDTVTTWLDEVLEEDASLDRLQLGVRRAGKGQRVHRVRTSAGRSWILKEVAVAAEWRAEVHAYRHWVPAIADRAPALKACNEDLGALVLSDVPGTHPRIAGPGVHRRAGAVLRDLHRAAPPRPQSAADRERTDHRVDRLLARSRDVLSPQEHQFVRERSQRLRELPLGSTVPCHGDFRTHNWLIDTSSTLRVIDFGKSRWELSTWDLAKLFMRPWWRRPRLAAAFLEGYGRPLTDEEAQYVEARMAVDALSHTAFGAVRGSERHVRFGRSRLADLMSGHRVVPERLRA